jgi:hypothetical protein
MAPGLTAFSAGCQGIRRISPITRAEEFYYPPWKRLLFQLLVSLPLCLACLICVFILMLGCFQLQVMPHLYSPLAPPTKHQVQLHAADSPTLFCLF